MKFSRVSNAATFLIVLLTAAFLFGCSSGGSSGGYIPPIKPESNVIDIEEGVFIDGIVQGLEYKTESQSGITNSEGIFKYCQNETITFSIGDIVIGKAPAKEIMTPFDFFEGTVKFSDPKVINICRFLQTLDNDCNANNEIKITDDVRTKAIGKTINFELGTTEFENNTIVNQVVNELTSTIACSTNELVPYDQAYKHFRDSLLEVSGISITEEVSGRIDSLGGLIEVENTQGTSCGVSIYVPEGALHEETTITINLGTGENSDEQQSTYLFMEPTGLIFDQPIEITIPYSDSDDPENLAVYYFCEDELAWKQLPTVKIDTVEKSITAQTNHFTLITAKKSTVQMDVELYNSDDKIAANVRLDTSLDKMYIKYDLPLLGTAKVTVKDWIKRFTSIVYARYDVTLKEKVDYWFDKTIEIKSINYHIFTDYGNGYYEVQARNQDDNIRLQTSKQLDFNGVEQYFSGEPILFKFDTTPDPDKEYYVEVKLNYVDEDNFTFSCQPFKESAYIVDNYDYAKTIGDMDPAPDENGNDIIDKYDTSAPGNNPPYVPNVISPLNGTHDVPVDTILQWSGGDPDGNLSWYVLYLSDTLDSYGDPLYYYGGILTTSYDPELKENTHYYWRIYAVDEENVGTLSPLWEFWTGSDPNNEEITWYKDADGDGYSDGTTIIADSRPDSSYYTTAELTAISGDFDDNESTTHPGATEICNDGIDNDCDGQIDEGCYGIDSAEIAAGNFHTVGLKDDGTVIAVGPIDGEEERDFGQCDVEGWTDITQIDAGGWYTIGLKCDGTVVAAGNVPAGLEGWSGITQVTGFYHIVGLKNDGTVVALGSNVYGVCNVEDWTGIVQITVGSFHTVGLKGDGTVVAVGYNNLGQCDVEGWTGITQIAAGGACTIGLKYDGTVVATGNNNDGQCDVEGWFDITQVDTSGRHTVGLKGDGTVVAVGPTINGDFDWGQSHIDDWTGIAKIVTGSLHTVGLKDDGTIVAVGNNIYGQCDVDEWNLLNSN